MTVVEGPAAIDLFGSNGYAPIIAKRMPAAAPAGDALLAHLAASDRQILMFELPLPPFYHEFGRIQRVMAQKHHVKLVPKRVFLSVIADQDATLDTIHLSQAGHRRMATCVWQLLQPAF